MTKIKYTPKYSFVIIVMVFLFAMLITESQVVAQQSGYPTPEEALEAALTEYQTAIGRSENWELGEILVSGVYSYTIASTASTADSVQDFVLLLTKQDPGGLWFYVAPEIVSADIFNRWLNEMPDSLIDPFSKSYHYQYTATDTPEFSFLRSATLHKLPWPIRREAILTQKNGSYHINQLDFVVRNTDAIYASKPGLVVYVKESSNVGGCDINLWPWANMVVVMHNLNEYTWYVHLKQNSVPVEVGDLIGYGTKLGEQGNTGLACGSTGIHLHFMVSTEVPSGWPDPTVPNYAPWPPGGSIVPTDFIEVSYAALSEGTYYESTNAPPPGICSTTSSTLNVYDNTYCNSNLQTINSSGFYDLGALGFSERIESVEVPLGWSVGLYREENELGPKVCLSQSDPMLWDNLFDNGEVVANRPVWMRVYNSVGCPYPLEQGIAFYPGANFIGTPVFGMVGERLSNGPDSTVGSVYIPGGYSARLFDQEDGTGNMICLSGSVLDTSSLGVWASTVVESVELVQGNVCDPEPIPVPQPILVRPADSGVAYTEYTELCWDVMEHPLELSYNVEITNPEGTFNDASGWISETCWSPASLVGQSGEFSWKVQAKDSAGDLGEWSVGFNFTLIPDEVAPLAAFRYLDDGGQISWPRTNIFVNAADGETKVSRVHYFAWYDDGSGAGYDWHYIGADEDGSDDWNILWSVVDVASEDVALWIYAEDLGGNFTSDFISNLKITDVQTGEGGIEGRDSGDPRDGSSSETESPGGRVEVEGNSGASSPTGAGGSGSTGIVQPAETAPLSTAPAAPRLASPDGDQIYYRSGLINLCWNSTSTSADRYRVEISGDANLTSPWVSGVCWQPAGLPDGGGKYQWRVQARNSNGVTGEWSSTSAFELRIDQTAPLVNLADISPAISNGVINVAVSSADQESGLYRLFIKAWYDAGGGYAWHDLTEINATDGDNYQYDWDVSTFEGQRVMVWVYAVDQAGNISADQSVPITLSFQTSTGTKIVKKGLPDVIGRSAKE